MVRRRDGQRGLGEVVLFGLLVEPASLLEPALRRIDALLDDEALLDGVWRALRARRPGSARRGRPSTAAEVVLRLLVLKHLKGWSYEQLEWEVRGSVAYRHFCRVGGGTVPDSKTLVRLGQVLDGGGGADSLSDGQRPVRGRHPCPAARGTAADRGRDSATRSGPRRATERQ